MDDDELKGYGMSGDDSDDPILDPDMDAPEGMDFGLDEEDPDKDS